MSASRGQVAAKVAESKRLHPERYCPEKRCLWRTDGDYCPRHKRPATSPRRFIFTCGNCSQEFAAHWPEVDMVTNCPHCGELLEVSR